jgi:hypothetical protein
VWDGFLLEAYTTRRTPAQDLTSTMMEERYVVLVRAYYRIRFGRVESVKTHWRSR